MGYRRSFLSILLASGCVARSLAPDEDADGGLDPSTSSTGSTTGADPPDPTGPFPVCGDGVVEGDEGCDDGGESFACDADCTPAACGDGVVNPSAGEACDDGDLDDGDACLNHCQAASCGDAIVQVGVEQCDDGAWDDHGPCVDCLHNVCGDGHVWLDVELCDDGNQQSGDGCPADCQLQTFTVAVAGQHLPLIEDAYDGALASMTCVTVEVTQDVPIARVALELSMLHNWIGDLVVKVVHPHDTVLTVLNRPGMSEAPDDGSSCCGSAANLDPAAPVRFDDHGPDETLGGSLSGPETACVDDGLCVVRPHPGSGPGTSFADFTGLSSQGPWRVCVGDANFGAGGFLVGAALTFGFE